MQEFGSGDVLDGFITRENVMAVVVSVFMFPLSLARSMTFLRHTSLIAMMCMLYLTVHLFTHSLSSLNDLTISHRKLFALSLSMCVSVYVVRGW